MQSCCYVLYWDSKVELNNNFIVNYWILQEGKCCCESSIPWQQFVNGEFLCLSKLTWPASQMSTKHQLLQYSQTSLLKVHNALLTRSLYTLSGALLWTTTVKLAFNCRWAFFTAASQVPLLSYHLHEYLMSLTQKYWLRLISI